MVVIQHHVTRISGACGHALGDPTVEIGGDVGTADAFDLLVEHGPHQVMQPVLVHHAVVVGIGDDLATGQLRPDIARHAQAPVLLVMADHLGKLRRDLGGRIGRAVIDENHFIVRVVHFHQGRQTLP